MNLIQLIHFIREDIFIHTGRKTLSNLLITTLFNYSCHVLFIYRLGHYLHCKKNFLTKAVSFPLKWIMLAFSSCDISFAATIGKRCFIPHPIGIVIGAGVVIGDDVTVLHHVTLGSEGHLRETFEYPTIHNEVMIFTASSVMGKIQIGKRAVIGAHSLVRTSVQENEIVAGVPAKPIGQRPSKNNNSPA